MLDDMVMQQAQLQTALPLAAETNGDVQRFR